MAITKERLKALRKQVDADNDSSAVRVDRTADRNRNTSAVSAARTQRTSTSTSQARREEEDELGGLLGRLGSLLQRSTELQNQTAYRNEEIRQEADRELGQAVANAITPDDPVKALGRAQRSTGLRTVPAERREEIVREGLREDGRTDEEIDEAKSRTPEALYNEYNQWLEEGDNRKRLDDLVQSERAARRESDTDERMHKLGYTDAEIEEIRARRREYEQSVPFGYDIGHRIASSAAGIGSQAVGSALMGLPVMAQGLEDFLLHDYDTRPEDIDGLAGSMYRLGRQIYDQGDESLGEARLGLSDMQDVAYSLGEMAGENVGMAAIFGPQALLIEQSLRALGGGVADMADEGRGAESAALSGLAHGAVSYGIERLGIAQMMRNMGRASGLNRVTDSIVDRIASLPGIAQLEQKAPWLAGTLSSAGEEATEEFVQTYADTAVDALLGRETPGLLSGELLNEAAQSAVMGAAGGGLIGGISSGIGAVQDVRQGRIAPRADLVANAQLSAAIERAGQVGRAQQAAAGAAQTQQERQAAAQVQQTAPEAVTESATTNPQQRAVDPRLAELAAQSDGRLDASAWRTMQQPQAENAESLTAQDQRRAVRQNWTDEQRAEAMLLEANTSMTEAAVNTAVEAMPADVSGDVYSVAANTVYQMARQGIAEDWDAALDLASRSGVRVNQILAAPGGAEALQMIYNRGQMDGIEAAGYSAAGLADERQAGRAEYQPGALVPEEDRALFDLYAAASDTAVTVSDRLEKNAGGYPGLFSAELTDPMEQLDRIAQVRQAIKPAYQNSYGESYEEARADLAMRIIGAAVGEGVTDQGVAGMLRQRINENLNLHRSGIQRRVVNALNEQERTARDDAFRQMQRVVSASGEANRRRLEAEREAWAKTSDQMRTAMARSRNTAQRARDARSKDNTRRVIASNLSKLNRMLLHPSDQYHVPQKLLQDAVQVAELANRATYNKETLNKLYALKDQLETQAKASDGVDSIAADWENSGISQMLANLTTSMERQQSARLAEQADAQTRRAERGLETMYEMQSDYMAGLEMETFSLDDLIALRDLTSAMVTVIQNSNKLVATRTAQNASEFGDLAKQEVESSPSRLKDSSGRLAELYNKYRANVYNAERFFNMLGGHRHGGAMETLGKALAAGEARQTEIREKGMQQFRDVLEGKENQKLLRRFAGQDAELIDVGLSTKINRAQMVSLYMHLQNAQNRDHVLKGGVVIPDMKEYTRGHIEKAYRTNRVERITAGTIDAIEKELTTGEMADYCQKWIADLKELLNNYTKGVINETSRRLSGYDKAKVEEYYPLAVDRDVLQKEIEGVVHNGTIEGRGFLKERREHSTAPVLLEEASSVMGRTLSDAAAYAGLAPAIRDANKIWNANRSEQGSLRAAVRKSFGDDGVNFVENYIADLQQQPRTRKNIFDFLSGMRGNYAGAVLTLNPGVALGQISGVAAAASDLGWKATWDAYREMLPNSAEHKESIRKEMMDHGYWQLEATLSDGPTAELNAVRQRSGAVQRALERIPGTGWLENMDMKTRMALWEGSKYYVDHHLEEFGLPADARGSDAWWGAVVSKMTEVNDRTQPNYTISQQSALQRDPSQLVKMLTMFRSQGFQNYGLVASAVEDVRAQAAYEEEYAQRAADTNLGEEERQQAQADLERVQRDKAAAWTALRRAASGQVVSAAIFVVAKMLVDDWLLHRYDREKDEEGQITPASVAGRAAGMIAENLMGNVYGLSEVWNTVANLFGGGEEEPVSLTGVDAISDLSGDLLRLHNAVTEDELDPTKVRDRLIDLAGSVGNLTGVPVARLTRIVEGLTGWIGDISTAANSDGLNLWDVMNAPSSSASQYDRLYTAVFEEPDPEDAAAALKRLADLDELTPPAKASDAKAGDSKLLTELLKREREYGSSVQDAAAARVAGNEAQQRQIRQQLVNTLADAMGIDQNTKEGQRRLRTVINKVDGAITDEVREQMGADSKTGATVYTPLLAALEDGGDPAAAQTVLRRAGITDSNIKSAVQGVYKDEYIYGDESTRQRIEGQLLALKDANGKPYFTKTKDKDDFADWVTDWELQGLNDNVYTDLDEALTTENKAAAKEQIDRYMTAGKSADSIRNRMASLYKQEYINADSARRREIAQFLVGLRGPKGEKIVTVDTLTKWIMDDAMAKATAGQ